MPNNTITTDDTGQPVFSFFDGFWDETRGVFNDALTFFSFREMADLEKAKFEAEQVGQAQQAQPGVFPTSFSGGNNQLITLALAGLGVAVAIKLLK